MTPLFTLGDVLQTPQGFVLAGSLNSPLPNNPSSVGFYDRNNHFISWIVQKLDFTVSTSNKINLFLLLGEIEIPNALQPGTTIYSDHLDPDGVLPSNQHSQARSRQRGSIPKTKSA